MPRAQPLPREQVLTRAFNQTRTSFSCRLHRPDCRSHTNRVATTKLGGFLPLLGRGGKRSWQGTPPWRSWWLALISARRARVGGWGGASSRCRLAVAWTYITRLIGARPVGGMGGLSLCARFSQWTLAESCDRMLDGITPPGGDPGMARRAVGASVFFGGFPVGGGAWTLASLTMPPAIAA